MEIVGLIPAGGTATRLGKLPCSKEIFPFLDRDGTVKVVSSHLIDCYRKAGIQEVFIIIRKGKWDIPQYYGDGTEFGVHIGYLIMNHPYGTPFTLNQAYPFVKDKMIAVGFPDIIFEPIDAFEQLISAISKNDAEIMLGIVPYKNFRKSDMIEFKEDGTIGNIVIKKNRPDLKYSWFIAVWKPGFTEYMKDLVEVYIKQNKGSSLNEHQSGNEVYLGNVIMHAVEHGIKTDYIIFDQGHYEDIGTKGELKDFLNNINYY